MILKANIVFVAIILLFSCKPDRLVSSFVVRNKIVERKPGAIDTIRVSEVLRKYDGENLSYFEIAQFNYKDEKRVLFSSDFYNTPVHFNFFSGFTRGFPVYDKYEKVNFSIFDSLQISDVLRFFNEVSRPVKTERDNIVLDYTLDKNNFITIAVAYDAVNFNKEKISKIKWMSIWMSGRRHNVDYRRFLQALKKVSQ